MLNIKKDDLKFPLCPPQIIQATAMYDSSMRENLAYVEGDINRRLSEQLAAHVEANYSETLETGFPGYARRSF